MATPAVLPSSRPSLRGRLALIVGLGVLALAYQAHAITDIVRDLRTSSGGPRAPFHTELTAGRIARVSDEAAAAGVKEGDRVVAVAGKPYEGRKTIAGALRAARPGDVLPIRVQRLGSPGEIRSVIQLVAEKPGGRTLP
ncbi:MAG TPA: hypothetical protein VFK70_16820, partial [Vicinamibacteria bacterium]|nr:hypothetical protein [Vicinamibacteria bacterium]